MNIHVHIERLVLHGLPVTNAGVGHVQTAVEGEIRRSLRFSALSGALREGGATAVKTATVAFGSKDSPGDIGRRIAHVVCRSLALERAPADAGGHQCTARGTRP